MSAVTVRALEPGDWPGVAAVYAAGIAAGEATFETEVPSWEAFSAAKLPHPRLVATEPGDAVERPDRVEGADTVEGADGADRVLGWAAASAVSSRCVYAGVAEHSVYVAPEAQGRGIGRLLLEALISATEDAGIWTLQAGIFPENTASLALHERCGFRVLGRQERIGCHYGRWRDVLLLERRSPRVGR